MKAHFSIIDILLFTLSAALAACDSNIAVQVKSGVSPLNDSTVILTNENGNVKTDEDSDVKPKTTESAKDAQSDAVAPRTGSMTTAATLMGDTLTLTWDAATDDKSGSSALEYYVCSGPNAAAIDTVEECLAATQEMDWSADVSSLTLTGKDPGTTYYYNIVVRDPAGNQAIYPGGTVLATAPTVLSVSSSNSNATYTSTNTITVTVKMSACIDCWGYPEFSVRRWQRR